jgi:hypothetical protein
MEDRRELLGQPLDADYPLRRRSPRPEILPDLADERHHHGRRGLSPRAKNEEASSNISIAH